MKFSEILIAYFWETKTIPVNDSVYIFHPEKKNRCNKNRSQACIENIELILLEVWRMLFARVAPARVWVHLEAAERFARGTIYVRSSFLKPVLEGRSYFYVTRAGSPRYIVNWACERSRLSERFSASSIFWNALPRLLLNGRAINYVNQKGHRASRWNDIGDIYGVYSLIKLSRYHRFSWAASISFQFHTCYFWNYCCFKEAFIEFWKLIAIKERCGRKRIQHIKFKRSQIFSVLLLI